MMRFSFKRSFYPRYPLWAFHVHSGSPEKAAPLLFSLGLDLHPRMRRIFGAVGRRHWQIKLRRKNR